MKILPLILLFCALLQCQKENKAIDSTPQTPKVEQSTPVRVDRSTVISQEAAIRSLNSEILQLLSERKYERLSPYIHPKKGLRFSMYAYTDKSADKHFSQEEFLKYVNTPVKFTWGETDGKGDLWVASLSVFFDQWVQASRYKHSTVSYNSFQGTGNSLNNLRESYPGADFTENHVPGTKKYEGMDWHSLRLVFDEMEGHYYLIAIINDQWTI